VSSDAPLEELPMELQDPASSVLPNWVHGTMSCVSTFPSQGTGITSLEFDKNGKLFAGSYDGSIKVFDVYSGSLLGTYAGHQLSVWTLTLDNQDRKLYSGGSDGLLNVWDLNSSESLVHSFNPSQGKLYSILLYQNRLFTASSDHSIHIWDCRSFEKLGSLHGHLGGVNSIKIVDNHLISASTDRSIKVCLFDQIWDLNTSSCISSISHHPSEVLDVMAGSNMLFASTYDANITAYSMNDFSRVGSMMGHKWEVWQLQLSNNNLFSGSHDHSIKRWDIRNFQNIESLTGHKVLYSNLGLHTCFSVVQLRIGFWLCRSYHQIMGIVRTS
jgi:WD40 repeat protein